MDDSMAHSLWSSKEIECPTKKDTRSIRNKKKMWADLIIVKSHLTTEFWCLGGDFNTIKISSERKVVSSHINSIEITDFLDFINAMDLVDFRAMGNKFM